jgi:hypothetical protein
MNDKLNFWLDSKKIWIEIADKQKHIVKQKKVSKMFGLKAGELYLETDPVLKKSRYVLFTNIEKYWVEYESENYIVYKYFGISWFENSLEQLPLVATVEQNDNLIRKLCKELKKI